MVPGLGLGGIALHPTNTPMTCRSLIEHTTYSVSRLSALSESTAGPD